MKILAKNIGHFLVVLLALTLAGCTQEGVAVAAEKPAQTDSAIALHVYKSPTCGCCESWIEHVEDGGFSTSSHHPDNLDQLKLDKGIAPKYQSCHTAISNNGYVFEGHVPAKLIQQFLANPPRDAIGLAVPGMPIGSPGMEMNDKFSSYQVLLIMADGSAKVFAEINAAKDQYN